MFAYDLEMLSLIPGELEALRREVESLLAADTPRSRWLRDLAVYDGYHERLRDAVVRAMAGDFGLTAAERHDPDISFRGYLRWCARQPPTPGATLDAWRAGRFTVAGGVAAG